MTYHFNWIKKRLRIPVLYDDKTEGWDFVDGEVLDSLISINKNPKTGWAVSLYPTGFSITDNTFDTEELAKLFVEENIVWLEELKDFVIKPGRNETPSEIKEKYRTHINAGIFKNKITLLRMAAYRFVREHKTKPKRVKPHKPKLSRIIPVKKKIERVRPNG